MDANEVLISIVIPVKNGEPWLKDCLDGILRQSLFHRSEILILDSGSTDRTLSIIEKYPVRLVSIKPGEFNHGATRNLGVHHARGRFVLFTVQDALPADDDWIKKLFQVFEDSNIAAVCGAQAVPHDSDKNPVDWYRPQSVPTVLKYQFTREEFTELTPTQKEMVCGWDNVNAMYRKSTLLEYPFENVVYGEDMSWAKKALENQLGIAYNRNAVVYHYHHEEGDFLFKRMLTTWYHRYKLFGSLPTKPVLNAHKNLSIFKTVFFKAGSISVGKKMYWLRYNFRRSQVKQTVYKIFMSAVNEGNDTLDKVHAKYCSVSPQHLSKKLMQKNDTGN